MHEAEREKVVSEYHNHRVRLSFLCPFFFLFICATVRILGALSTGSVPYSNPASRGTTALQSLRRDSFFLFMSVSIGGLVIMPLRNYLLGVLLGKVAFRSMFFVLLVLAVLLILGESHHNIAHPSALIRTPLSISHESIRDILPYISH